jgi:Domain of unknown function (DUF6883)
MRIPSDAIIAPEKLTQYLLSPRSRNDKSRYLARAGFSLNNPQLLEGAIRALAATVDATEESADQYGTDYTVSGSLMGPNGASLNVTLVWIRPANGPFRFVTLKPSQEKPK